MNYKEAISLLLDECVDKTLLNSLVSLIENTQLTNEAKENLLRDSRLDVDQLTVMIRKRVDHHTHERVSTSFICPQRIYDLTAESFQEKIVELVDQINYTLQDTAAIHKRDLQLVAGLIYMLKATSNACLFTLRDIY